MQYMCVCVYMYTVCSCVMSAYTENLKAHAKKLLELVSNYIKIAGNKVNIYKKSIAFLYSSHKQAAFEIKNI